MNYSENELQKIALSNPKELARILMSHNMPTVTLTFGAEILGNEVSDEAIILPPLRLLLKHINAVVREGAMIGISSFYYLNKKTPPNDIIERLTYIKENDPSPHLKSYAKDILEEFK